MILDSNDLQAIRECCRDDAAFERVRAILTTRLADLGHQAELAPEPINHNQTEVALRESEARYRSLYNNTPIMLHSIDGQGRLISVSEYWLSTLGYSRSEVLGRKSVEFMTVESRQYAEAVVLPEYFRTGVCKDISYQFVKKTGEVMDVLLSAIAERGGNGEIIRSLAVLTDITERRQTEERLLQTETQYRRIFEAVSDGLVINDPDTGVVVEANPAFCRMHGYTREEFVGLSPKEFIHPDSYPLLEEYFATIRAGGTFRRRAVDMRRDGTPLHVEVMGTRFHFLGKPHLLAVVRDITEQVQAERANDRERRLFAAGPVVVFRWLNEENWPVEYVSANVTQFGYQPEDFTSGRLLYGSIVHPDDVIRVGREVEAGVRAGQLAVEQDYRIIRADGEIRWIYDLCGIIQNEQGEITHYEGYVLDITERKRAEQALLESEEKFSKAFRSSPAAVTLTTLQEIQTARIVDINESFLQITGYQREEVVGLTVFDLNLWVDPTARAEMVRSLQASGSVRNLEMKFRRKSGDLGVALLSAEVIQLRGEACLLTVTIDITDRKQAQEALEQSEARNRAFLNAIPDMMLRIHRDGTYLDCKAENIANFAIPPAEMIGRKVYDVLPAEVAQARMDYVERTLHTGTIQVYEYQLASRGEVRDYEARLVVSGKDEVLAIIRDITDRKRTEAQLRANAERDRLLGQIALRIRRSLNLDQILTTTVEEVRQFLGADRVFIGQIDLNWQGKIVAESAATEWGSILAWITNDLYMQEIRALFAQGQVRAIDDTAGAEVTPLLAEYYAQCQIKASLGVPILLDDQFLAVLVAQQCSQIRHWSPFEIELMSQLSTQIAIAIQQAELYQQVQTLNAGLEQQVQERTAQLQQSMVELQQLNQVKDDFLHAVSHDLRTPVMGMLMVLKNLQNKAGETATLSRSVLDRMVQSSDRQIAMINSLLEAHSTEVQGVDLHCEPINIGLLVRAIVDDLEALIAENQATLINQISPNLPSINADPALIRRVFENLLTNALKHNLPGLQITLEAKIEEEMLRCSVQDNGVGMTQQECESLFERYAQSSRTRRSPGIGLGLYLCRQIIIAHGGQIGAISSPGEGATFWFTLPLVEG
jgi:PAS domain S-box-containing protein